MIKFSHNKDYYVWLEKPETVDEDHVIRTRECLALAEISSCDNCEKPCFVNAVWVVGHAPQSILLQADKIKEQYGVISDLYATEDGDCYCEGCYEKLEVI